MRRPTGRRPRLLLWIALAALVVGLGAISVHRLFRGSSALDDTLEYARELVLEGTNAYETHRTEGTHSKYPPFFFLVTAPLALLPLGVAGAIWFLLNTSLSVACCVLAVAAFRAPGTGGRLPPIAYASPGLLAAVVIVTNLSRGQVNILILFFVCLGLYAFRRGRDLRAGLALGIAVALKLTPLLLVVYLLYRRAWRVALGTGIALIVAWAILPALVFGPREAVTVTKSWVGVVQTFSEKGVLGEGVAGVRHTNQSLSAAFHRFFTRSPADAGRTDFYLNVASLDYETAAWIVRALSALVLLLLAWFVRGPIGERGADVRWGYEISLVLLAVLIISPISWINHYVVLIVAFAAALEGMRRASPGAPDRRLLGRANGLCALFVTLSVVLLVLALSLPLLGALLLAGALAVANARARRAFAHS